MSSNRNDPTDSSPAPFLQFGKVQTEALLKLQKEFLDECEQASRAWHDRVNWEMELWSGLAAKVTAARSVPEALKTYQKCVAEWIRMNAEDRRWLFEECQKITQKITRSLNGGGPTGSA